MIDPNGPARIAAEYFPGTGRLALALSLVLWQFTGVGVPAASEFLLDTTHAHPGAMAREEHQKQNALPIARDDALGAKWRKLARPSTGCEPPANRCGINSAACPEKN